MSEQKKLRKIIRCGVAVILRNKECLIAQRKPNDSYGLYWEFPGGKKDSGEMLEACAVREAQEELGVKIRVRKKLFDIQKPFKGRVIWLHFFLCEYLSGKLTAIECQKTRWVPIADLIHYKFPPANERVIKILKQITHDAV